MGSLERRIAGLEDIFRTQEQAAEEAAEGLQAILAAWDRLAGTMAPEHVRHVLEEWAREPTVMEPHSRLAKVAEDMITWPLPDHLRTLPPEVAQVYLNDRAAHPFEGGEDCGYRVPARAEWWHAEGDGGDVCATLGCGIFQPTRLEPFAGARIRMVHHLPVSYFANCPLCGGRTGVRASYRKHGVML